MARNHVTTGKTINYVNTGSTVICSGGIVVMDALIGIAITDIPAGKKGAVMVEEVFKLPASADLELAQGAKAYWNIADKNVVDAEGEGVIYAGVVFDAVSAGAGTVNVKLNA